MTIIKYSTPKMCLFVPKIGHVIDKNVYEEHCVRFEILCGNQSAYEAYGLLGCDAVFLGPANYMRNALPLSSIYTITTRG
jgi:hypothetical protein